MGVCHDCKCFYCQNLCSKRCPVSRVCSTCYKGINNRNFKIIHCDRYEPYEVTVSPKKKQKPKLGSGKKIFYTKGRWKEYDPRID